MSDLNHQINLALRTAAGHERAALTAETQGNKAYEMKMKSAGASVYEAFGLAVRAAPEYQGRKIDDAAIKRIFQSNVRRPWWDKHLTAVKVDSKPATREWASRTLQWHFDPEGAAARRATGTLRDANRRKRIAKQGTNHGAHAPRNYATTEKEIKEIKEASLVTALGGRELQNFERQSGQGVTLDDLRSEHARIGREIPQVNADDRGAYLELLQQVRLV